MPGGGGALAAVHSGQGQAAAGQHDGSALLQPGLTCTGRTETLLSSGARHRIWASFDRRHSSPRARSDKMLTVWKLRLVERKRLPCEPAAGWLVADFRWRLFSASSVIVAYTLLSFTHIMRVRVCAPPNRLAEGLAKRSPRCHVCVCVCVCACFPSGGAILRGRSEVGCKMNKTRYRTLTTYVSHFSSPPTHISSHDTLPR